MNYITDFLGAFLLHRKPGGWSTEKRNFSVLSFRIKGDTVFTQNDKQWRIKSGEILYVPPQTEYMQTGLADEEIIALHFNTTQPLRREITAFSLPIYDLFAGALETFRNGDDYGSLSFLYKILSALERQPQSSGIALAEQYLAEHYTESATTVSRLAEIAGISETHFRNLFKERNGTTPLKYLQRLRLERAQLLLSTGYYTVKETAPLCGYDNEKNFTTAFKNVLGISPGQFKNAHDA